MNVQQQRAKGPNKVEQAGYALLESIGASYLPQHLIADKFCVDAFVPSVGVVVQFDGDYWHANPAGFPEPDARQQKRIRLDRSQDAYMSACGFRVVRVWASELKRNPEGVKAQLRASLVR